MTDKKMKYINKECPTGKYASRFNYKLEDRLQKKKDNVFAMQKQSVPKRI